MGAALASLLASIENSNIEAVRQFWRQRWGEPPKVRAGDILRRAAAERLQEEAYGIDREHDEQLASLVRRHRPGQKPKVGAPPYQAGTRLTREWQGVLHEVTVISGGYVWQGQRFASLSKVAREITGVRWNGPRFFGLRQD
jgi:hypothetical protein